jgi:hypothetical protein
MTQRSRQQAQEGLRALGQELEQLAQTRAEGIPVFLEPALMQALMLSVDFLPEELQPAVRQVIDTARVLKGSYGSYFTFQEQFPGEQMVSLHEDEAAAYRGLARVKKLDVAGRVEQVHMTRSLLPSAHAPSRLQEVEQWAVLISSQVDRKALLARLYPHTNLGAITTAYDRV